MEMSDEEAGTEEGREDEHVNVVCGAPTLAFSRFESDEFAFSEIVRRKELESQTMSEIGL